MRAGQLNEIITLYKRVITLNEYNEQKEDYVEYIKVRADVQPSSSALQMQIERETEVQTVVASVRSYVQVAHADRVKWRDNMYDVSAIMPDRKLNRLVLTLKLADYDKHQECY